MLQEAPVNLRSIATEAVRDLLTSDRFGAFCNALYRKVHAGNTAHIATVSFRIAGLDALAVLEWLQRKEDFHYFWERPEDNFGISAGGTLVAFEADGPERFQQAENWFQYWSAHNAVFEENTHSMQGLVALGGFSFFDDVPEPLWNDFGAGKMVIPKWAYVKDGKAGLVLINRLVQPGDSEADLYDYFSERAESLAQRINQPEQRPFHPSRNTAVSGDSAEDRQGWVEKVEHGLDVIRSGVLDKVVLARRLEMHADQPFDALSVVNALREHYPSSASFLVRFNGGGTFAGCSPEKLASTWSDILQTEAVAGSIARGRSAGEDAMNEQKLFFSEKDRHEHQLVLSRILEQLTPLARKLEHPNRPEIRKLANVQHLVTPIRAVLKSSLSALSVAGGLHPTPAVCGTPTDKAGDLIKKLELFSRGWYASPVGWMCSTGRSEFSVGIRSALIKEKAAFLFAGCGIVAQSNPEHEWEETRIKFQPMLQALANDRR